MIFNEIITKVREGGGIFWYHILDKLLLLQSDLFYTLYSSHNKNPNYKTKSINHKVFKIFVVFEKKNNSLHELYKQKNGL